MRYGHDLEPHRYQKKGAVHSEQSHKPCPTHAAWAQLGFQRVNGPLHSGRVERLSALPRKKGSLGE